jgi:sugar lactone lactonase YvrE
VRIAVPALAALSLAACYETAEAQVTFTGTQITIAGSGVMGQDGQVPVGVALDGKGNLFFANQSGNAIVEVPNSATGFGPQVTVLRGLSSPGGVASDWSGNLFIADTGNNRIMMLPVTAGGFGAPAQIASGFNSPTALAVDAADNVFVADTGNNRVVELPRVGSAYGAPVAIASGFSGPMGVAVDAAGSVYIADTGNNLIYKALYAAGSYSTPQLVAKNLFMPRGLTVDKSLNLYIADTGNSRVVQYPWNAGAKRYNSPAILGSDFASPVAVGVDLSGNLYVADGVKSRLQEVLSTSVMYAAVPLNSSVNIHTYDFMIGAGTSVGSIAVYTQGLTGRDFANAGTGSCSVQTYSAATQCGVEVSFTPLGSGLRAGAVVLYDPSGNPLATAYLSGVGLAAQTAFLPGTATSIGSQLSGPSGVAVDGSGNVYIADTGNNRVVEVPFSNGSYGNQITMQVSGLNNPMGLDLDGAGNLFIVSNGNDKVIKLPWLGDSFGTQVKVGNGLYGPSAAYVDASGNAYISDTLDNNLLKLPWTGSGYAQAQFMGNFCRFPVGVTTDTTGNLYFAMPYQNALAKVPWTGSQYLPQATVPMGGVSFPSAIAMDGNSNLYIVDSGNNRVVMLAWNGTGFASPVTVATGFNAPSAIALDGQGNLYIADTGNNQIVKIDVSHPAVFQFSDTYLGSTSTDSMQVGILENIGNQSMTIDSVSYPVDFPGDPGVANACAVGVAVAPGKSCKFGIDFTPSVVGALSETAVIAADIGLAAPWQLSVPANGNSLGRLAQTINFPSLANVVYGAPTIALAAVATSGLPVTYQVVSGAAVVSGNNHALSITGAGLVAVRANQPGNASYAPATSVMVTFQVLPATLTVTPANTSITYGAVPATFSYSISGFVLGQSAGQVVSGRATVTANESGQLNAGSYTLAASQGTLTAANYIFQYGSGKLTVNKAILKVLATSTSAVYASASPQLNWTISGFASGDTVSVVTGIPQMTIPSGAMNAVGTYAIAPSPGTLSAANYSFSFVSGTLKVTPAVLTVTADNQTMVYGSPLPSLTYTVSGLLRGDALSSAVKGMASVATTASSTSGAGWYPSTPSLGSLQSNNYSFRFVQGSLVIGKDVLTVTPANAAMTYGGRVPALPYSIAGFVHGDTAATAVAGSASIVSQASSKSRPGTYAITATAGGLTSRNYSFAFANGSITVSKATLTVKPVAAASTYGAKLPTFAYQLSGFVNGDGISTVQGAPAFTSTATSSSPVGIYTVTGGTGTLSSNLYSFSVGNGTLSIGKAAVTVQANAVSMTYGGTVPVLTYTFTGFVNGDSAAVVTGKPALSTTAARTSPVGIYQVNATVGNLYAANYSFVPANGKLSVTRAALTLTPSAITKVYGGSTSALSYTVSGLLNGDTASVVTGNTWYTGVAATNAPVGLYTITMNPGSLKAGNYDLSFATGIETVTPAVLTVTPANQTMTYGAAIPALSYSISGFVAGDTAKTAISGVGAMSTAATATPQVGQYTIQAAAGTLTAANYSFVYKTGTMTVKQAPLTVAADNLSIKAGSVIPTLTYTLKGLVNGDTTATAVKGTPVLTTTATTTSPAGGYPITVAAGSLSAANYSFTLTNGTLTLTQ